MRLTSIWLMPPRAMTLRERLHRTGEWALIQTAHHMPRELAFRTFIAVVARYSWEHPQAVVPDISVDDVLKAYAK